MKVSAVSINHTSYYNIAEEDKQFIAAIHDVYIFDSEAHTYCCEITPSYELIYLYTQIHSSDELGIKSSDNEKYAELDEKYCHESNDDMYMWCTSVKKMNPKECGEFESMDDAREHLSGNYPF